HRPARGWKERRELAAFIEIEGQSRHRSPLFWGGGQRGSLEARNARRPASAPPGHPARGRTIGHGRAPGPRGAATGGPSPALVAAAVRVQTCYTAYVWR